MRRGLYTADRRLSTLRRIVLNWGVTASSVLELVARMRRDAFSRNRNFDAFANADADTARARRLWRYLRSLEHDLVAAGAKQNVSIRVELVDAEKHRITIEVPEVRIRRTAIVSHEELELLREHPDARALLDSVTRM
jgi:hypothetical protein